MNTKICEYCGTEYKDNLSKCPLCGKTEGEEMAAETVQNSTERIPRWMWILTCVLLGIAVVIGFVYFVVSMKAPSAASADPVVSAPVVEQPVEDVIEVPVVEDEPEVVYCTELLLSQEELTMDEQGGHVFLTASPLPYECEEEVFFVSLDEEIATVDENGMITAVAAGETEIVVTCGDVTVSCVVICKFDVDEDAADAPSDEDTEETPDQQEEEPQAKPELSVVDFTLFYPGEETFLTVKNAPEGANITYATGNASVVTVNEKGKVTAVGNGNTIITVMVGDVKLTCDARCKFEETTESSDATETPAANYNLSHVDVTFSRYGETFYLTLRDSAGNKVTGVSYSSNNTSVCSVDANGLVTATGRGMTRVIVTYGGKTYSCDIHCEYLA